MARLVADVEDASIATGVAWAGLTANGSGGPHFTSSCCDKYLAANCKIVSASALKRAIKEWIGYKWLETIRSYQESDAFEWCEDDWEPHLAV